MSGLRMLSRCSRPHLIISGSTRSLTTPNNAPSKTRRTFRGAAYVVVTIGAVSIIDKNFNASALMRTVRTLWTCAVISLDYKLNFNPENSQLIPAIHERVANRVYHLMTGNGGLYIKIGQAIGANAALLPRPMQETFSKLFDDAPQIPYSTVLSVFLSEFGRPPTGPDGVFEEFEEEAVASASVAQVHRAKLKTSGGDGPWVAVKIQKPDVSQQVEWDLGAFRIAMWMFEKIFELPVYFAVDFISDHLRAELDFESEANNATRTASFVVSEPRLKDKVYVPKVYSQFSTKKILTAEWIDGVRFSDRAGIRRLMDESNRDDALQPAAPQRRSFIDPNIRLKGGMKAIMQTMVELFSAQIFRWGWVHCDPHPGNFIVRPNPQRPSIPQLVLLDHGLYVYLTDNFRRQYATLWKSLLTLDYDTITGVAAEWGIGSPDLFASATMLRPVNFDSEDQTKDFERMSEYERSVMMSNKLRDFLTDTDKMPKELIFIGRNMRLVQGNNQSLGSPVNRIKITGYWASQSLTKSPDLTFTQQLKEYLSDFFFRGSMVLLDILFWISRIQQVVKGSIGLKTEGFEDELERSMRVFAKANLGMDIAPAAFQG